MPGVVLLFCSMQKLNKLHQYINLLGSRVALNLYFWLILIVLKYPDADDQHAYAPVFYYGMMLFFMAFFAVIAYLNNLVLLPLLLFKGRRLYYLFFALFMVTLVAFVYTYFIKYLPMVFPGFDTQEVSMIMTPVSADLSFFGIVNDMQTYWFMMVVWAILFTLLGYYHHNAKRVRDMETRIAQHQQTELHFLKNQLNPHFLFNTLNNLYGLALKKSDDAPGYILRLSAVLRYVLYEADAPLVSFEKEKEVMQAYIDIELLRFRQHEQTSFVIAADRPYHIPPLIWLPVLENAFKYSRSLAHVEIDFNLEIHQNQLVLACRNRFNPSAESKEEGGIGLANLKKRLSLLFPERYTLESKVLDNYFYIEVTIANVQQV